MRRLAAERLRTLEPQPSTRVGTHEMLPQRPPSPPQIGAPTDADRLDLDYEAMDRLDAEGKLDVIGRVLKFMDPCARGVPPRRASRRLNSCPRASIPG